MPSLLGMLAAAATSTVATATVAPVQKARIALYDIKATEELTGLAGRITNDVLVELTRQDHLMVISQNELELTLRASEVAACADDDACLAKLARAADVEEAIVIRLAKGSEGGYFSTISVVAPDTGAVKKGDSCFADRESDPSAQDAALVACVRDTVTLLLDAAHVPEQLAPALDLEGMRLGVFTLASYDDTTARLADNLTEQVSLELKKIRGPNVLSWEDVQRVIDWETIRAKCIGESIDRCVHDILGRVGVDYLVTGGVGKLSDTYVLHLKLIDIRNPGKVQRIAESFRGPQSHLGQAVRFAVYKLIGVEPEGAGSIMLELPIGLEEVDFLSIDGRALERTSNTLTRLSAGKHAITVQADGHYTLHQEAYVEPNALTKVHLDLIARPVPWYEEWWAWAIIGGVVAAGVSGTIVVLSRDDGLGTVRVMGPQP